MPSSDPRTIPDVLSLAIGLKPNSILEIGPGFGKYGVLLREYLDVNAADDSIKNFSVNGWATQIDAIEIFPEYITPLHDFVYNNIFIGNAIDLLQTVQNYDLILIIDVIEHFTLNQGASLLDLCKEKANIGIIITTPSWDYPQGAMYGNEHERHLSYWPINEMNKYKPLYKYTANGNIVLFFIPATTSSIINVQKQFSRIDIIKDYICHPLRIAKRHIKGMFRNKNTV